MELLSGLLWLTCILSTACQDEVEEFGECAPGHICVRSAADCQRPDEEVSPCGNGLKCCLDDLPIENELCDIGEGINGLCKSACANDEAGNADACIGDFICCPPVKDEQCDVDSICVTAAKCDGGDSGICVDELVCCINENVKDPVALGGDCGDGDSGTCVVDGDCRNCVGIDEDICQEGLKCCPKEQLPESMGDVCSLPEGGSGLCASACAVGEEETMTCGGGLKCCLALAAGDTCAMDHKCVPMDQCIFPFEPNSCGTDLACCGANNMQCGVELGFRHFRRGRLGVCRHPDDCSSSLLLSGRSFDSEDCDNPDHQCCVLRGRPLRQSVGEETDSESDS